MPKRRRAPQNYPSRPLDVPEIRTHIAIYLNRNGRLSCMHHTIDFSKDKGFITVTPKVLDKYGIFISHALNAATLEHIMLDTLRRNQKSLQSIDIFSKPAEPDTFGDQLYNAYHFVYSVDAISALQPTPSGVGAAGLKNGGGLTALSFSYVCM
ncbi:hypothetical protein BGW39_005458 [Mortierella sp. 14UC]|nr:hypothetical protein BGW39_005458 [Mortierella sp. 14UC]